MNKETMERKGWIYAGTYISKETHATLKEIAVNRGYNSISGILRLAINEFLKNSNNKIDNQ